MGLPNGNDVLEDYELDVLILLPVNKRATLTQRSAALKANPPPPNLILQSPRLAGVLTSGDALVNTYTGCYDFLNSQAAFDTTFPLRTLVGFNAETHVYEMNKFIDLCMLEVFF